MHACTFLDLNPLKLFALEIENTGRDLQAQEDKARADGARGTRRREIEARVAVALQQREARDAVRAGAELGTPGQTRANERKASGGGAPKG